MGHSFHQYPLDPRIHEALKRLAYKEATEVQGQLIPQLLKGKDAVVSSKTGSGKTASYLIPILDRLNETQRSPQLLVLVPTRELAAQVKEEVQWIGRYKKIQAVQIFGQQPMDSQILALKQRVHVVVATPGRLIDHIGRASVQLDQIRYLVMDEADKLLEMGFLEQVEEIVQTLPRERVTVMLSATIGPELEALCLNYMKEPIRIVGTQELVKAIQQSLYYLRGRDKEEALLSLMLLYNPGRSIIFCNTKDKVEKLQLLLKQSRFHVLSLHGGLSQKERLKNIKEFKEGKVPYLIATDLAARGIHVDEVECVINYDLPNQPENYIHRIGRTGRIDREGYAISMIEDSECELWEKIQEYILQKAENNGQVYQIEEKILPTEEEMQAIRKNFVPKVGSRNLRLEENSKAIHEGIVRIRISGGKDKKLRALDIVGAISGISGMRSESIGVIEIQKTCSYVEIFDGLGELVYAALQHTPIKGKIRLVKKVHPISRYTS